MKKIIISINIIDKTKGQSMGGGASFKAPHDILEITLKCGYTEHLISVPNHRFKFFTQLVIITKLIQLIFIYPAKSHLLIQYPCINPRLLKILLPLWKKFYLQTIIHDINSIRVNGQLSTTENNVLSCFNEIIVHSNNMKDYLHKSLKNKNIQYKIIDCFPYIAEADSMPRILSKNICFAGNIDKSLFMKDFIHENKDLNLYLYGALKNKDFEKDTKVFYKGVFYPNNIKNLEGSWGLVWDGDSPKTCNGNWGTYLKIIAPHKFSLYILAGLPLIVWNDSAMATLVKDKEIGITINSLSEISNIIEQITTEQYQIFCRNLRSMQEILTKGTNYSTLLQ